MSPGVTPRGAFRGSRRVLALQLRTHVKITLRFPLSIIFPRRLPPAIGRQLLGPRAPVLFLFRIIHIVYILFTFLRLRATHLLPYFPPSLSSRSISLPPLSFSLHLYPFSPSLVNLKVALTPWCVTTNQRRTAHFLPFRRGAEKPGIKFGLFPGRPLSTQRRTQGWLHQPLFAGAELKYSPREDVYAGKKYTCILQQRVVYATADAYPVDGNAAHGRRRRGGGRTAHDVRGRAGLLLNISLSIKSCSDRAGTQRYSGSLR